LAIQTRARSQNQLPLKMLDRILDMASRPGDRILDPFAGSGTTLVAAELKHRHWVGIEIESVEPIVGRFETIEQDTEHLDALARSKNRLFTDDALRIRKKRGRPIGNFRILDSQEELLGPEPNGHQLTLADHRSSQE